VNFISWSMQTGWVFPLMVLGFVFILFSAALIIGALISARKEKRKQARGNKGPGFF